MSSQVTNGMTIFVADYESSFTFYLASNFNVWDCLNFEAAFW